ncbi:cytochrome C [Desulfobacterota bacterium AH_259_B03_O07]|nr:cytochrome C [Desulfobacterota bacterium AH_259_B03_O07]
MKEEPWHPVPAAYLRSLFYANLKPVNWELIEKEYSKVDKQGYQYVSIFQAFAPLKDFTGEDHTAEIKAAIDKKDRFQLYSASTRALSQLIRYHLHQAQDKLNEPGFALENVNNAKRIYRAFEDFIEEVDQGSYDDMGKAWLEMTSSIGSAGVLGVGIKEPSPEQFLRAREFVEDYLIENYEEGGFKPSGDLAPLPFVGGKINNQRKSSPWLPPGSDLNDQDPLPRLVLNFEARGIDEKDLFLVAFGDMLFDSPEIFGEPARTLGIACATCHNRSDINKRFVIPGISRQPGSADVDGQFFNPHFNDHRQDPLDIPSLRGLRFTAPYGRDGRFTSLRDFVRNVIVNEFGGQEPSPLMLDALVAYMLEFDWLPSTYLNPDGTLNDKASIEANRGQTIFNTKFEGMGDRACTTCHIPSANFIDGLRHDIGSGNPASPGARDSFFDTPNLINIKYTSPYFHDGSFETLSEVVDWFNQKFNLGLTKGEKSDLTAYLEAVGTGEEPFEEFTAENTRFLLDWSELSTFLSTLNTLIPAQDKFHTELLLKTVSKDLRADSVGLQDLSQAPRVYALSDKLNQILEAVEAGDWKRSTVLWTEYQDLENRYSPEFK